MRILVSRTDGIGDVVLTLPLCGLLKSQLGAEVVMLARGYTRPLLEASPYVDRVLDWDSVDRAGPSAQRDLLASAGADILLHVRPRPAIARAARAAGIPVRIGTSRRWYHWLTCTTRERFTRRGSELHEAQLNVRLARTLLGAAVPSLDALVPFTGLVPREEIPDGVRARLDDGRLKVVLHPLSHGSGVEWPLASWRELAESLDPAHVQLIVTGSPAESVRLSGWLASLPSHVVDLTGQLRLGQLIALLAEVDGLAAASTGPLHIASALGANTVGLYSPTVPCHPARWAPLGRRAGHVVPVVPCDACRRNGRGGDACACLQAISVAEVRSRIEGWMDRGVLDPGAVLRPAASLAPATAS